MFRRPVLLPLCFSLGVLGGCAFPVRVQSDPQRPILVAQVGTEKPTEDGGVIHNPQLPVPELEAYDIPQFNWGKAIIDVATGNWTGLAASAIAAIAGGYGVQQRRQRAKEVKEARQERDELAELPPEQASPVLRRIKSKEGA